MATQPKSYDIERCLQSEQATVGSCLILDRIVSTIRGYLKPENFYHKALGAVFEAVCSLADIRAPVDIVSVSEELRKCGNLEAVGGTEFLASLIECAPFGDHGEYYAKIVLDYFYEREIIRLAGDVVSSAADSMSRNKKCTEYLEELQQTVLSRNNLGLPSEFNYTDSLYDVLDNILKKKSAVRYEVGFPTLDATFLGLTPGEVITWGAATNIGKSLVVLNIASHCVNLGQSVLYVGTEMTAEETVSRHLSILTSIEPYKIKSGNLSHDELCRLKDTLSDRMHKMPMRIIDLAEPSLSDVESALSTKKVEVVVLDYLQRFKLDPGDTKDYRLRINEFMRRVKNLARKYEVVIHLVSQLSRLSYELEDKRPSLSHLSESSAIEKESDRVLLIWAPKEKNKESGTTTNTRILEVILAKNRHGRRGLALDLQLDEKSLRVTEANLDPQQTAPYS